MSVREKLNDKKLGIGVAVGLIVVAGLVLGHYFLSHWTPSVNVTQAYFTDDDGQTYYKDTVYQFPPFEKGGKTVSLVTLGESNGHRFIAFLSRYTPSAQKELQKRYDDAVKNGLSVQKTMLDSMTYFGGQMEVKLPGSGHSWVPTSQVGRLDVRSPDGKIPDKYIDQPS
jgi:hypothetical protein